MALGMITPLLLCVGSVLACMYCWRRELNASWFVALSIGAAMGASAGLLILAGLPEQTAVALAAVVWTCITICEVDRRHFIIPDILVACLFLTALVTPFASRFEQAIGALLIGGIFLAVRLGFVRLRGAHGLGLGDVKLAAVMGVLLGPTLALAAIAAAAGATAIALYLSHGRESADLLQRKAPLGVGLSAALALALVFEVWR